MMINQVVITGCTAGLGWSLAKYFADQDMQVYAIGRQQDKLAELESYSKFIIGIVADITSEKDRALLVTKLLGEEPFSIIHNAVYEEPCTFAALAENNLRKHFETNFFAPLFLTQQLLGKVKGQRKLHITSGAAQMPLPGLLPYCTSKAAFQHAASCLNEELKPEGTLVASLRPGMLDTPLAARWRAIDPQLLPGKEFYVQQAENKQLISTSLAAKFIYWVLCETADKQYQETVWNIYDETYQNLWLGSNELCAQDDKND